MSKIIVVVGATGSQGGSVIDALLRYGTYNIRGLTRDVSSPTSKALSSRGVEMVAANLNDEESLVRAFKGASAIFAVTDFYETFLHSNPWIAMETEYQHGMNLARAAKQITTLEHYVWSTLPSAYKISEKKSFVAHFEAKARVDEFIKSSPDLLAKTTFLWLTFFVSNFLKPTFAPVYSKWANKYLFLLPTPPTALFGMLGDNTVNTGIFVRSILDQHQLSLPGKYVLGNVETISISKYVERWAAFTGKKAQFVQVASEDYNRLFPAYGTEMESMFQFWSGYGEQAWSGEDTISAKDLGIESQLVGLEQAWKGMDWSILG